MSRRYQTGRPAALAHTFLDDDGNPLALGAVTVAVTADGATQPVNSGDATQDGDGWTYDAGSLPLGVYAATWTADTGAVDTTVFEVVGGYLFSIPDVRNSDIDLTPERYSADAVRRAREDVEAEFEQITGRSFTTRVATFEVTVDRDWRHCWESDADTVTVPVRDIQAVLSVTDATGNPVDGTFTVDDPNGFLAGFRDLCGGTYRVTLQYGFRSAPSDIKRAALTRVRYFLVEDRSGIPDRATSFQPADGGTYTLATPGRAGFETGVPDVDATLARYSMSILNDVFGGV